MFPPIERDENLSIARQSSLRSSIKDLRGQQLTYREKKQSFPRKKRFSGSGGGTKKFPLVREIFSIVAARGIHGLGPPSSLVCLTAWTIEIAVQSCLYVCGPLRNGFMSVRLVGHGRNTGLDGFEA